mgnify:CR=1 FL=1
MKNVYDIIKRPVITEQSMESVADKKYVFMVDVEANKTEVKAAVEEIFGVLHFGFVDKAHVSEAAVGKFIDNGTTEPLGEIIVDESTDVGSESGTEDNKIDIQASVTGCGFPCCGGNYHF